MNYVDRKYCGIVGTRVDRFKVKSEHPYKANFRCPLCGDSDKSRTKARGWLLEYPSVTMFHCHNCGVTLPLPAFLKHNWPAVYNEYIVDTKLDEGKTEKPKPLENLRQSTPKFTHSPLKRLKKISSLKPDHKVKQYVTKRGIPSSTHYKIYYAPKFNAWVNSFLPDKLDTKYDEPRLVLPFIDNNGKFFGLQGRYLSNKGLRYITIMVDETQAKVFGLDTVDMKKRFFVVEGPIDSLFLDNAVAMAGADVNDFESDNAVYVFDNEPRNKEICRRMSVLVDRGKKIVVWPNTIHQKDINDMVLAGHSNIERIMDQHTYQGLTAQLELSKWRKCNV